MWRPGFDYLSATAARLDGYHRAFCVYSIYYRGTPKRPGLVLGLTRGGVCRGIAYEVAPQNARRVIRYLRAREQITGAYRETLLPIRLTTGGRQTVIALTFVCEPCHPGFAGRLTLQRQALFIRAAQGRAGSNLDYALNTIGHLQEMSCCEPALSRLATRLGPVFARRSRDASGLALSRQLRSIAIVTPRAGPRTRKRFLHRNWLAARYENKWPATG